MVKDTADNRKQYADEVQGTLREWGVTIPDTFVKDVLPFFQRGHNAGLAARELQRVYAKGDAAEFTLDAVVVFVYSVGDWGRGDNLEAALNNAKNPKKYQAFIAHRDTWVDNGGYVHYPVGFPPREIARKGLRGSKFLVDFTDREARRTAATK